MLMSITGSYAQNSNNGSATSSNILENYKRLDISFASTIIDNFDDNFNGVSCGVIWGTRLSKSIPLFIEYGANVSWTTRKYENDLLDDDGYYYFDEDLDLTYTFINASVPINIAYKFALPNNPDVFISPFVGINCKYNIIGMIKAEDEKIDFFNDDDMEIFYSDAAKRFQVGMNFGLGLSYKQLYIGYRFQPDYMDFIEDTKTKTNYVTLGINF